MDNEKKQVTYNSSITGETQVTFDIQQYMNNRARPSQIWAYGSILLKSVRCQ